MQKYKYKFSVVIPIYNVYDYLEETILSVINQNLDFEKDIQIILVNDGSPDNSEEICLKYRKLYPKNIIYIKQENAGVSAARNKGLEFVEGEFVNFLDSDDKWQNDAFIKAYNMFRDNLNIDVVAFMLKYFDAQDGTNHPLNYKFREDTIINISTDFKDIELHAASCFIRTDAIKHKFDKRLKYGEDALFINQIILEKLKYGIISSSYFYYRKRSDLSSAINTCHTNLSYYKDTLANFHKVLINLSKKKYGYVLPYVQYVVMYDLQWRIKNVLIKGILSNSEINKYKNEIHSILQFVEDNVILNQRYISANHKLMALKLKYGEAFYDKLYLLKGKLYLQNQVVYNFKDRNLLKINVIDIHDNKLNISGRIECILPNNYYEVYCMINDTIKKLEFKSVGSKETYSIDELMFQSQSFKISEKLNSNKKINIRFFIKYRSEEIVGIPLNFTLLGKLDSGYRLHYTKDKYVVYRKGHSLVCKKKSLKKNLSLELYLYIQLLHHLKFKQLIYRISYHFYKLVHHKKIWLISDRTTVANDNGMRLFKYIVDQNNKNIKPYFVIDKNTPDYLKMKKIGKVIPFNSFKYKMYFLMADKIISSQADQWVLNAFGKNNNFYRDLYTFDYVFLQHGITKNDISGWLNYNDKNIKIFVTAANKEYESIINGNYGYSKNEVKLTGFPRYDTLISDANKTITIMPTWRKALQGRVNVTKGTRDYNFNFKNSEYFNFYNNLINDQRLINIMKKYNYKGIFVIHPSHKENYVDFKENSTFKVVSGFADYQTIFKEANLLVSDYSSVAFDFAYLKKPVVYAQFDKKTFMENHIYTQGYFNDKLNGFGPVTDDYEDTVNEIIKYIENDCKMEDKYLKRVDSFYKYIDKNNCKRVYEEILKLGKNK